MKIVNSYVSKNIMLKDVKVGQVFRYVGTDIILLKTDKCKEVQGINILNAVGLEDGHLYSMNDNDRVEILEAEVVIK